MLNRTNGETEELRGVEAAPLNRMERGRFGPNDDCK